MAVYTIVGSIFQIGTAVALKSADFVTADFTTPMTAAKSVGEPETLAAPSDEWQMEDFGNVTDGRIKGYKSQRKGKALEIVCGLDPTDAGQLAMRAACEDSSGNYAMRLTLADKPATGASPKNSTRSFVGCVTMVEDDPGGKIGKVKFTIQPNSNIVVTHASAT